MSFKFYLNLEAKIPSWSIKCRQSLNKQGKQKKTGWLNKERSFQVLDLKSLGLSYTLSPCWPLSLSCLHFLLFFVPCWNNKAKIVATTLVPVMWTYKKRDNQRLIFPCTAKHNSPPRTHVTHISLEMDNKLTLTNTETDKQMGM